MDQHSDAPRHMPAPTACEIFMGFLGLGLTSFGESMGVGHLAPVDVILWAVIAAVLITLVFVPLEIREKFQKRRHRLAPAE